MELTTGAILRRITETPLSTAAHKLATIILDCIAWKDGYNGLKRGTGAFTQVSNYVCRLRHPAIRLLARDPQHWDGGAPARLQQLFVIVRIIPDMAQFDICLSLLDRMQDALAERALRIVIKCETSFVLGVRQAQPFDEMVGIH